jgi:hypothetical protein
MLLPILAAGFIYINTTAINVDNIIALEPTKDGKQCLVHLITKNPFAVEAPCSTIADKIPAASKSGNNSSQNLFLGGLAGLVLGGLAGLFAGGRRRV